MFNEKDQLAVDTLRAPKYRHNRKANSGHPGLPMELPQWLTFGHVI